MIKLKSDYPTAIDPKKVGTFPAYVNSGGGYFYDEVLEYRVWIHSGRGSDTYSAFATYEEAKEYSKKKTTSVMVLNIKQCLM